MKWIWEPRMQTNLPNPQITWMEKEKIEHLQLISTVEKLVETPNNLPVEPIECCQQRINYLETGGKT
jgi:hypothetical protein